MSVESRELTAEIGSIEHDLALSLEAAGLPLRCAPGGTWCIDCPDPASVDPTLADIAAWLHGKGHASAWRDELLAVVDAGGRRVGAIERAAVRPLGISTLAVHLVVSDEAGRVWVQQRAFDKSVDPGQWDTTVGGLVSSAESIEETLMRETWEEAGLRVPGLLGLAWFDRATVRRRVDRGFMVERLEMFEAIAPRGTVPNNRDGEVAQFSALDIGALLKGMKDGIFTAEAAMIHARWLSHRLRRTRFARA